MKARKSKIFKLIIPLLVFTICLSIYLTKNSIALSKNENDETIETVTIPNDNLNGIGLINKLNSVKLDLSFINNEIRNHKCK